MLLTDREGNCLYTQQQCNFTLLITPFKNLEPPLIYQSELTFQFTGWSKKSRPTFKLYHSLDFKVQKKVKHHREANLLENSCTFTLTLGMVLLRNCQQWLPDFCQRAWLLQLNGSGPTRSLTTIRVIISATRSSTVHRCDGSDKFGRQLICVSIPTTDAVLQRQSRMSLMTIST